MPYQKLCELPESVKNVLPKHAQEICQAAFNSAEESAYKVAWSAVKNEYHQNENGDWVTDKE